MKHNPQLSVVLPCYNEAENIPTILNRFDQVFAELDNVEVILVDNGSHDNTREVLECQIEKRGNTHFRIVFVPENRGYGHGIMTGIAHAKGQVIAWTHADMQTDPLDILHAWKLFQTAPTPTTTFLKGRRVSRPIADAIFTAGMSLIASILLRARLTDINAQPKMFDRSFLELLQNPPLDFSLDLYAIYTAATAGFTILQQPVKFAKRVRGEAKGGGSLLGKIRLVKRTLLYILALRGQLTKEGH